MNESLGHLAAPLPTSPAGGAVPYRDFGWIVPDTLAGTLPLAGMVGGGGATRSAF